MNLYDLFNEEKVRLDPHCWHNKKIGKPKTKMKGGVRVNNCVPKESVEETLGKQIHSTFQTMGDSFSDAHLAKGISYFLQGRHQEGENWLRGKIPPEAQDAVFGKLKTLQAQGGVDVNKNLNVQKYIDDKLVPWVKNQIQQNVKESTGQPLSVQQLATISDAALDAAYGYGRSTPGNTFGWQANLASAAYAKQMIDKGVTDIIAISDAVHKGWWSVAQKFVDNPDQFSDTEKLRADGKFDKKMADRKAQMVPFNRLTKDQQDIDTVVARALLQAIRGEQGVSEGVMYGAEELSIGDPVVITGNVEFEGKTGDIVDFGQDKRFVVVNLYNHGRQSFHSSDVSYNDYAGSDDMDADDHDDDMLETRKGQVPMTLKPGETDNLEPEDIPGFRKLPAYKQGQQAQQQAGQTPIQKSPYTFQSDQDFAYRQGAFDTQQAATSAQFANLSPLTTEDTLDEKSVSQAQFRTMAAAAHNPKFAKKVGISQDVAKEFNQADKHSNYKKLPDRATEGEQQPGADYRDPPEDKDPDQYGDDYQAMVARVKKLAGIGPMKTVWDPNKRVYRNVPTADQPKR